MAARIRPRRYLLILVGLAVAVVGAGIGLRDPWGVDEERFLGVAIEMLQDGSWLVPHRAAEPYPDKPPLFMWLLAVLCQLTSAPRVAMRLPGLLSGILCAILMYDLGRRPLEPACGLCRGTAVPRDHSEPLGPEGRPDRRAPHLLDHARAVRARPASRRGTRVGVVRRVGRGHGPRRDDERRGLPAALPLRAVPLRTVARVPASRPHCSGLAMAGGIDPAAGDGRDLARPPARPGEERLGEPGASRVRAEPSPDSDRRAHGEGVAAP